MLVDLHFTRAESNQFKCDSISKKPSTWDDLPKEIMEKIFSYLDSKSQHAFSLVNYRWRLLTIVSIHERICIIANRFSNSLNLLCEIQTYDIKNDFWDFPEYPLQKIKLKKERYRNWQEQITNYSRKDILLISLHLNKNLKQIEIDTIKPFCGLLEKTGKKDILLLCQMCPKNLEFTKFLTYEYVLNKTREKNLNDQKSKFLYKEIIKSKLKLFKRKSIYLSDLLNCIDQVPFESVRLQMLGQLMENLYTEGDKKSAHQLLDLFQFSYTNSKLEKEKVKALLKLCNLLIEKHDVKEVCMILDKIKQPFMETTIQDQRVYILILEKIISLIKTPQALELLENIDISVIDESDNIILKNFLLKKFTEFLLIHFQITKAYTIINRVDENIPLPSCYSFLTKEFLMNQCEEKQEEIVSLAKEKENFQRPLLKNRFYMLWDLTRILVALGSIDEAVECAKQINDPTGALNYRAFKDILNNCYDKKNLQEIFAIISKIKNLELRYLEKNRLNRKIFKACAQEAFN